MKAYPMEFRESVAAARDGGMSMDEVLEVFPCSASWVRRLLQRRREGNGLAPIQRKLRDQRRIQDQDRQRLREFILEHPDATLAEMIQALGLGVHPGTLSRTLAQLDLPRKKSPCTPASRTGPTSSSSATPTSSSSPT
jgi:transposase